jgi:hypothetical protein
VPAPEQIALADRDFGDEAVRGRIAGSLVILTVLK